MNSNDPKTEGKWRKAKSGSSFSEAVSPAWRLRGINQHEGHILIR
jgi:hypothetical protein